MDQVVLNFTVVFNSEHVSDKGDMFFLSCPVTFPHHLIYNSCTPYFL